MIIKSHIRGGFRQGADYLKEQGKNELTRLVEMSDPQAGNLNDAFQAMWAVSDGTKVKKPLHHISINPMKEERLTDKQVKRICEKLEERYGYVSDQHQRVIVEHIKEGRQHFHVMWNRVNFTTGKPHYPFKHKMQSKIAAREMETELGLKRLTPRRVKIIPTPIRTIEKLDKNLLYTARDTLSRDTPVRPPSLRRPRCSWPAGYRPAPFIRPRHSRSKDKNTIHKEYPALHVKSLEEQKAELVSYAFENHRLDILAYCGIFLPPDFFLEP